jgi:glutaminyl-peptide cyclotransferase
MLWRWLALAAVTVVGVVAATFLAEERTPTTQAADNVPQLRVQVLARYPHDTTAFTEGLELHDGLLYEGTGLNGESDVRIVQPETGQVRDRVALPDTVFGEGITVVDDRIWQLTFKNNFAFVRDRSTLAELQRVNYDGEGWGLCHDPARARLVMSNGSAQLAFRDPRTFQQTGTVSVTMDGKPLDGINELECVGDRVWANVFPTDQIVRIDPAGGTVEAVVDAAGLLTEDEDAKADVLNGIAAVPGTDTFMITGKYWPWTFLVRFARLFLAGESFPGGLAGDAERGSDPRPGHAAPAQLEHPVAEVGLDLLGDRGDARDVVEHLLVRHRIPHRHAGLGRLVAVFLDDRLGQADALVADVHAGPADQPGDLGVRLAAERASEDIGVPRLHDRTPLSGSP